MVDGLFILVKYRRDVKKAYSPLKFAGRFSKNAVIASS